MLDFIKNLFVFEKPFESIHEEVVPRRNLNLGLILAIPYLVAFSLSEVYVFYSLVFHAADSAFSGLFSIILTIPWSMLIIPILDLFGYIAWYEQFSHGSTIFYGIFASLPLLIAALINAKLLYLLGKSIRA